MSIPPENTDSDNHLSLQVDEANVGNRLDAFLASEYPQISRSKLQTAILGGDVLIDGQPAKPAFRLKGGETVDVILPRHVGSEAIPEDIPLDILFEDDAMVAINKPPAMVVHPAKGHWSGTLVSALAFHFQQLSRVGGRSASRHRSSPGPRYQWRHPGGKNGYRPHGFGSTV